MEKNFLKQFIPTTNYFVVGNFGQLNNMYIRGGKNNMAFISKKNSKDLLKNMLKKNNDKIMGDNFTAQDGTQFKFGVTEDGKYGYVVKDENNTDVIIPFNKSKTTGNSIVLPTNPDITIEPLDGALKISWNAPESEVEIDHYNIYYSESSPSSLNDMTKVGETKELEYTINGLSNDATYYIGIQSVDINNNENASIWKIGNGKTLPKQIIFVTVSEYGYSHYSTDGLTWKSMSGLDSSKTYNSVTYGNGRFVCVGANGSSYYSTDGLTWAAMSGLNSNSYMIGVAYGNGRFVCVGVDGSSYYSTDGLTWKPMSGLDSSIQYNGVTYGNDRFVCVSNKGTSYYSTDGITWNAMSGLSGKYYFGVTYGNGRFVCVGYGSSYYSTDGLTWNAMSGLYSGKYYRSVTYGNGRFVCVGESGKSYYSTDGLTWNAMSGLYSNKTYYGVTYGNDRFVCVGDSGYSAYSTDGVTWNAMSGLISYILYYGVCSNDVPEE